MGWRFWLAAIVLVILGNCVYQVYRSNFAHFIDASASITRVNAIQPGNPYVAILQVHMGGPVDVECVVQAVSSEGTVAGSDAFTLDQVDGPVTHDGELTNVTVGASVKKDLDIDCRRAQAP